MTPNLIHRTADDDEGHPKAENYTTRIQIRTFFAPHYSNIELSPYLAFKLGIRLNALSNRLSSLRSHYFAFKSLTFTVVESNVTLRSLRYQTALYTLPNHEPTQNESLRAYFTLVILPAPKEYTRSSNNKLQDYDQQLQRVNRYKM